MADSAHNYKNIPNAHASTQRTQRTHACVHARRDIRTDWHWGITSGIPFWGPISVGNGMPGQYPTLQYAYPVRACVTQFGKRVESDRWRGDRGWDKVPENPRKVGK
jgi:hypothetical protein